MCPTRLESSAVARRTRYALYGAVAAVGACSDGDGAASATDAGSDAATARIDASAGVEASTRRDATATPTVEASTGGDVDAARPGRDAATGSAHDAGAAAAPDATTDASDEAGSRDAGDGGKDGGARGQSLWNGVDLSEWDGDPAIWKVVDGAIVGFAPSGTVKTNTFLTYRGKTFGDFVLTGDAWLAMGGNSGIQYRSSVFDAAAFRVRGYQADMGPTYWGQITEELGRGILQPPSAACLADAGFGKWLAYEITAVGREMKHRVDGIDCIDYVEMSTTAPLSGVIALQYHVPGGYEVRFKNLHIETR
jgi:hypothetical protein